MGTFKDGDERLSDGGASCGSAGRGGGGGRRILADLVAHLSGDITQTLRHRLAPPETLNAPVQEADPAEQQVRVVAQRHEDDDGGDEEEDDAGQQVSSSAAGGRQLTLHRRAAFCFGMLLPNKTEYSRITNDSLNSSQSS